MVLPLLSAYPNNPAALKTMGLCQGFTHVAETVQNAGVCSSTITWPCCRSGSSPPAGGLGVFSDGLGQEGRLSPQVCGASCSDVVGAREVWRVGPRLGSWKVKG